MDEEDSWVHFCTQQDPPLNNGTGKTPTNAWWHGLYILTLVQRDSVNKVRILAAIDSEMKACKKIRDKHAKVCGAVLIYKTWIDGIINVLHEHMAEIFDTDETRAPGARFTDHATNEDPSAIFGRAVQALQQMLPDVNWSA
jgi:hypothetical protein